MLRYFTRKFNDKIFTKYKSKHIKKENVDGKG